MEADFFLLISKLRRSRDQLVTAAQLAADEGREPQQPGDIHGTAANNPQPTRALGDVVQKQLDCARQAVEAVSSAAARSLQLPDASPPEAHHADSLAKRVVLAIYPLSVVADSLARAGRSLPPGALAAITEAQSLVTQMAGIVARLQQRQALQDAGIARAALSAGDRAGAASAALQAEDAVAVAMWAAGIGGLQLVREVTAAQRAALEAMEAVVSAVQQNPTGAAPVAGQESHTQPAGVRAAESNPPPAAVAATVQATAVSDHASIAMASAAGEPTAAASSTASEPSGTATPGGRSAATALPPAGAAAVSSSRGSSYSVAAHESSEGGAHQQRVVESQEASSSSRGRASPDGLAVSALPNCPPPMPASHYAGAAQSALSQLADLADQTTADGRLSESALRQAAQSCADVHLAPDACWMAASTRAWTDPDTRYCLVKVLSFVVRQPLEMTAAVWSTALEPWCHVLVTLVKSISTAGIFASDASPSMRSAVADEVVLLLVRTDLVQCLIRLLAFGEAADPSSDAATVGAAGAAVEGMGAAKVARASTPPVEEREPGGGFSSVPVAIMAALQGAAIGLLSSLVTCARFHHGQQGSLRQLRGVILKSRAMEHVARTAVLRVTSTAVCSGGGAGANRDHNVRKEWGEQEEAGAVDVFFAAAPALTALSYVLASSSGVDRPLAVWSDAVLSGPCTQYFLLLHTVSQLCAVDGGPDYGLPSGTRLPAIETDGCNQASFSDAPGSLRLSPRVLTRAFHWWEKNSRTRPCSDRALRAVCERAVAAAHASVAADGSAADAGGSSSARGHFSPPEEAMQLAVVALDCAVGLTHSGAAGDFRGLWAPAVDIANTAVRVNLSRSLLRGMIPLLPLAALPLPPLGGVLTDTGSLPAQPGPDLAAALVAGYVPALERTLRNETRLAGTSAKELLPVLQSISSLLGNPLGLASLMAYGKCTQVAALLVTSAKVVVAAIKVPDKSLVGSPTVRGLFRKLAEAAKVLHAWDGSGSEPVDRLWWRRHGGLSAGRAAMVSLRGSPTGQRDAATAAGGTSDRAASNIGGGSCNSGGGSGGGGPSGSSGGGGASSSDGGGPSNSGGVDSRVPLPPLHQLSLLATFAATRWLPVFSNSSDPDSFILLPWLPPLLHAYLHCSTPPVAGGRGGRALAPQGIHSTGPAAGSTGASASEGGDDEDDDLRAAAVSWEALLLEELDVPGLVTKATQQMGRAKNDIPSEVLVAALSEIAEALVLVLVAFPCQARAVLQAPVGTGRKAPLLGCWLRANLAGGGNLSAAARYFLLKLTPAVAAGKEPSAEDLARLRSDGGEWGWAARAGALLPPPCFVAAALQLQLCSNPGCTNLQGDSEAGLMLPGRKGGGGLSFCSRACQLARVGSKEESGAAARAGARGRGRGGGA